MPQTFLPDDVLAVRSAGFVLGERIKGADTVPVRDALLAAFDEVEAELRRINLGKRADLAEHFHEAAALDKGARHDPR